VVSICHIWYSYSWKDVQISADQLIYPLALQINVLSFCLLQTPCSDNRCLQLILSPFAVFCASSDCTPLLTPGCSALCTYHVAPAWTGAALLFSSCKRLDSLSPSPALKLTGAVRMQHSSIWQRLRGSCTLIRNLTISAASPLFLGICSSLPRALGLPNSSVPQSHPRHPEQASSPPR